MHVAQVIPLSPGVPFESLSYFSKEEINPGDLVLITIKRRELYGLVISIEAVNDAKIAIKKASFGLKKITKGARTEFIPGKLYSAIMDASSLLLVSPAHLLYDLLRVRLFAQKTVPKLHVFKKEKKEDTFLLGQPYKERMIGYKSLVRESFAKKESLVIFMPTLNDIERVTEELKKGIEDYVVILHSGIGVREFSKAIKTLSTEIHPILILTTPTLLPWIREDLTTVIIEKEHSLHYFTVGNESYDMREVLGIITSSLGMKLVYGSQLLTLDRYLLYKERSAFELMPLHMRNDVGLRIVPMDKENYAATPYLSHATLATLKNIQSTKQGHYFIYTHRKGMYPTTICSDCGTLFTCQKCDKPYILHMIGGVRTYVCHNCEAIIRLDGDESVSCAHCGGWRMRLLGIATGGIEESIHDLTLPTFLIDGEHTNTRTKSEATFASWKRSHAGILIGTEMAHNLLDEADGITIASLDSMFSLPEYRTDEKIMSLVTELAEKTPQGSLILQTRLEGAQLYTYLKSYSFAEYYQEMLKERYDAKLPPYFVVVKGTFININDAFRKSIDAHLEGITTSWFEAGAGKTFLFLHIEKEKWKEDKVLRNKIKNILRGANPQVNPQHLFS